MFRAHFINIRVCDGVSLAPWQGARSAVGSFPTNDEQRGHGARITPSLRVAARTGVCFAARLAQGMALGGATRLASIPSWRQRTGGYL